MNWLSTSGLGGRLSAAKAADLAAAAALPDSIERVELPGDAAAAAGTSLELFDAQRKLRVSLSGLDAAEILALGERGELPAAIAPLKMYGASWCPDCRRAERLLDEARVAYDKTDIDGDAAAEALVLGKSGGRRVIPTFAWGDRLWAFNPDPPLLKRLLAHLRRPLA